MSSGSEAIFSVMRKLRHMETQLVRHPVHAHADLAREVADLGIQMFLTAHGTEWKTAVQEVREGAIRAGAKALWFLICVSDEAKAGDEGATRTLLRAVGEAEKLAEKSDEELAVLLREYVWSNVDIFSLQGSLVEAAIDRLSRRA